MSDDEVCPCCERPAVSVEHRADGVSFYGMGDGVYHLTGVPVVVSSDEVVPLW